MVKYNVDEMDIIWYFLIQAKSDYPKSIIRTSDFPANQKFSAVKFFISLRLFDLNN